MAALELVATFTEPRQVTGVAVAQDGRIFVNFPRWDQDVAISVALVGPGGALTPYPDAAWNSFRAAQPQNPEDRFVCVQSVVADPVGNLWVLDPAAPGLTFTLPGGPKAVCIDLATNAVSKVHRFGEDIAPQGSYLNDIRFTPDGGRAVITDSGQPGALIALDVASGRARRVLAGHPSTSPEPEVTIEVRGKVLQKPDGQTAQFAADGIAIDMAGEHVFWQATTGRTLYRIPVASLFDGALSESALGALVERVGTTFLADGYCMARDGRLYLTSVADSAVKRREADGSFAVAAQDDRLFWPDSMAEGPDGAIYVTASHIPEMVDWQGPGVKRTELFRFTPG